MLVLGYGDDICDFDVLIEQLYEKRTKSSFDLNHE